MKTSIILCTYNGEKYLEEQLDSLRIQTQKPDEVLILDDCSTDHTVSLVEEYIARYGLHDSWKLRINTANMGYADNFRQGLKDATGDVIFFCDQDDIWNDDKIEKMCEMMVSDERVCLLGTEFTPFYSSEDAFHYKKEIRDDGTIEHIELNQKTIFIDNGCEGCVVCIRRDFRDRIIEYWADGIAHDDFVWKMALCEDGCFVWHRVLMQRRFHSNNTSKQKKHTLTKRSEYIQGTLMSLQVMASYAQKLNMSRDAQRLIKRNTEAVRLRLRVLHDKSFMAWVKLATVYLSCYPYRRSLFTELVIGLKKKSVE